MNRFEGSTGVRRSFSSEPRKTLSFLNEDDGQEENEDSSSELTTHLEGKNKSKTEKSVHFADEESVAEDDSSLDNSQQSHADVITWVPSEHLYSQDTFIEDTETNKTITKPTNNDQTTSLPTTVSYGASTFVELETDENTNTEPLYSYTESFVSSEVFSSNEASSSSNQASSMYREWKDVTEIVKDIDELEESEFVTRADSLDSNLKEGEETEASETFEEEIAAEAAYQDFVSQAIRNLRLCGLQSPRSLTFRPPPIPQGHQLSQSRDPPSKEERTFCRKMIQACQRRSESSSKPCVDKKAPAHPWYNQEVKSQSIPVESCGLNPALVERLKLANLQHSLNQKSRQLDQEISESEKFVNTSPANEALASEEFLSRMCSYVQRVNMEDAIQAHLIKMNPVTQFAQFVSELPSAAEDAREILYEYKRQLLEKTSKESTADVT